jgi:fumarate hydratase class II
MPMIAHNLLESIELLANAATVFADKCVVGIEANVERARELVERNIIVVTALNPHIGYDNGAIAAKEAFATGRNVADVVVEKGWLTQEQVTELLDIKRMTEGGVIS